MQFKDCISSIKIKGIFFPVYHDDPEFTKDLVNRFISNETMPRSVAIEKEFASSYGGHPSLFSGDERVSQAIIGVDLGKGPDVAVTRNAIVGRGKVSHISALAEALFGFMGGMRNDYQS